MNQQELRVKLALAKRTNRASELMSELVDLCNTMSNEDQAAIASGMLEGLQGSHRTLQQSFCKNLASTLQAYGQSEHYDGRNEASIIWACEVSNIKAHFPFI